MGMSFTYWIFVAATSFLLIFLSYSTFMTARFLRQWRPDRNLLLMPAENVLRLALIAATFFLGRLSGLPANQLGWDFGGFRLQFLIGLSTGIALAVALFFATRWLLLHGGERYYSAVVIEAITPQNRRELILVLLAMLPVVLLEELLFRSLLIGGFQALMPAPLLVIGWGIFFGALHSPQGVWGMIGAGIAGIILGLLFLVSGSLIAPLVAHYITNAVQILQAMRLGYGQSNRPVPAEPGQCVE